MTGFPISHSEDYAIQSEIGIVLLGDTTADKRKVAKLILCCESLAGENIGLCTLYKSEIDTGRNVRVVVTPGWNRISIQQTPENVKAEIVRSVSLCPTNAFLLVLPVKDLSKEPSTSEITEAQKHVELLSERVWKHTIVLFDCDVGVEESALQEHIHSAGKILEKCRGRFHVLRRSATQMSELLKKIERLVEENSEDVFKLQKYYELIQRKSHLFAESEIWQRRGSLEKNPPNYVPDAFK